MEAKEQRRLIMLKEGSETSHEVKGIERSALISKGPDNHPRSSRKGTHCKKNSHMIDYCWDLHPEKKAYLGTL